jgi:hypothetical protein
VYKWGQVSGPPGTNGGGPDVPDADILLPRAQEKMTVPHMVGCISTAFGYSRLELLEIGRASVWRVLGSS